MNLLCTTPFAMKCDREPATSIGFRSAVREIASIIKDFQDPEGSGGDARRTSYTLSRKFAPFFGAFLLNAAVTVGG
jgi:hypothetical protein